MRWRGRATGPPKSDHETAVEHWKHLERRWKADQPHIDHQHGSHDDCSEATATSIVAALNARSRERYREHWNSDAEEFGEGSMAERLERTSGSAYDMRHEVCSYSKFGTW